MDDLDAAMPTGWRELGLGARAAPASSELAGPVALVTIALLAATMLWRLDRRGMQERACSALSSYLRHRQEAS